MIDYLDFVAKVDDLVAREKLRIWRQLTLLNGRPVGLYVSGEKGRFGSLSLHMFITYIKTAQPHDFERFASDCYDYALKATEVPQPKQLVSSCLILPCIATHTTFRELVQAAETTERIKRDEQKKRADAPKNSFLQTAVLPCLLNLTTHKSFHSGAQQGLSDAMFKTGEEFLDRTVVSANSPNARDPQLR